jgi:hypothetical protein
VSGSTRIVLTDINWSYFIIIFKLLKVELLTKFYFLEDPY